MIVFKFIALLNLVMICTGLNYSKQSLPATNIFTEFLSNKTDRTSQMVDGLEAAIRNQDPHHHFRSEALQVFRSKV